MPVLQARPRAQLDQVIRDYNGVGPLSSLHPKNINAIPPRIPSETTSQLPSIHSSINL